MKDSPLLCVQCEESFDLTAAEWGRYERMGFDLPKRCPSCRRRKHKSPMEQPRQRQHKKRDYHRKYETAYR
jgi:ssDNA-binding Zn-finger/Zn-ribbon topoisomerase 1